MRHHRRADDPDGEQHRLVAGELGHDGVLRDCPERRVREVELAEVADADHDDERGDHGFERPEPVALQAEDERA